MSTRHSGHGRRTRRTGRRPGPAATVALALVATLAAAACGGPPERPAMKRGLIILGVDGMDPRLLQRYMREGRVPNLAALAEAGKYRVLGTSNPPQSPVAWSTFLTGQSHEGHGIYDFVHRDPVELAPYLSTSRTGEAGRSFTLGSLRLSLSSGEIELLRRGQAFWQVLERAGVPATVVKVPANFPPAESRRSESMAGMGTPDLLGTYGTFQLFTDNPRFKPGSVSGGIIHRLDFGGGQAAAGSLHGPPNPVSATGETMEIAVEVIRDRRRAVALVRLGDAEVVLTPGEWSAWLPVAFEPSVALPDVGGMVRLFLAQLEPHAHLYVSPINLDPLDPAMPISSPSAYAENLAREVGRFYTQGMPEDTKALAAGALTDEQFLAQAEIVWQERLTLLERELARYRGGALFFYFSSIDQLSHVFWRSIVPDADPADARHAHVLPELYQRIDRVVGEVLLRFADHPEVDVVIMSDHGFAPYTYKVHLNTWLAQQGYLSVLPPERVGKGPLGHIDWDNTQAYALGLNQLFVNLRGREAHGAVPPDEYDVLIGQLKRDLEAMRDPQSGARVITEAVATAAGHDAGQGGAGARFRDRAPDLLIGYNRGYRSSDESALGILTDEIIVRNRDKWSGDHCMHPSHVPGVLFSTLPLAPDIRDPDLADLAPSILAHFGVSAPPEMTGRGLFVTPDAASSR